MSEEIAKTMNPQVISGFIRRIIDQEIQMAFLKKKNELLYFINIAYDTLCHWAYMEN